MDLNEIRKLARLMIRAELSELEIEDSQSGTRVHLKREAGGGEAGGVPSFVHVMPQAAPQASGGGGEAVRPAGAAAVALDETELPPGTEVFPSPMVGTFYRASSPDSEPFVVVGTEITEDSVVCIIEAMKVMNEIKSEIRGTVAEILVENGEPVEFGQPLFLVKKG